MTVDDKLTTVDDMKAKSFVVKAGSVSVSVYGRIRKVAGRRYTTFEVCHYTPDGVRKRQPFNDETKARVEAERIAAALSCGQVGVSTLSATDADRYRRALALLEPTGADLIDVVSDYVRRHPPGTDRKTVRQIVEEFLRDGESRKLSAEHLSDLRKRLSRFSQSFTGPLANVTPEQFRMWIRGLTGTEGQPLTNRTKFNFQRIVSGLFQFAARARYVPRDLADEIAEIDKPKPEAAKAEIFSPKEAAAILDKLPEEMVPAFVLGAFAGLRPAEIARLDWSDIRMDQKVLIVGAHQAKTASRRVVPLSDNLVQWLARFPGKGAVCPFETAGWMAQRFSDAAAVAGIPWKRNALRHSFISYRLALTADPARVATESGNSAAMVHKHYKALVTEAEAKAWFAIAPQRRENLVSFSQEAA